MKHLENTANSAVMSDAPPKDTQDRLRYVKAAPRPPEGPIDLQTLSGAGPIELDVGFGRGNSVFSRAKQAPGSRILGVEVKTKCTFQVDALAKERGLSQVTIWTHDVRELLPRCGPDACLTKAFVHFPDPWWKKRHQKRMVITKSFLDELARLFCDGAQMFVQTDVPNRAEQYLAELQEHPEFEEVRYVDHNPFSSISNRERTAESDGLPIHRIVALRRARLNGA